MALRGFQTEDPSGTNFNNANLGLALPLRAAAEGRESSFRVSKEQILRVTPEENPARSSLHRAFLHSVRFGCDHPLNF